MKRWLLMIGGLLLVSAVWGQETLALSVKLQNADPGLAGVDFTEEYYVDSSGRLVRARLTRRDNGIDAGDTQFKWTSIGVSWQQKSAGNTFLVFGTYTDDGIQFRRSGPLEIPEEAQEVDFWKVRWADSTNSRWTDGTYQTTWTADDGVQRYYLDKDSADGKPRPATTTTGSRITQWQLSGGENQRLLMNKKPNAWIGTFVTQNEELTGWIETGTVVLWGPGLWNPEAKLNLIHLAMLEQFSTMALYVPFIMERRFLK